MPLIHVSIGNYKHVDLTSNVLNVPSRPRTNLSAIKPRMESSVPTTQKSRPQTISTGQISSIDLNGNANVLSTESLLNSRKHIHSDNTVVPLDLSMTFDRLPRTKTSSTARLISGKSTVTHSNFHISVEGPSENITRTELDYDKNNRKRKSKSKYPNSFCCFVSLLAGILAALCVGGIATGITFALLQRTTSPISVTTTETSTSTTTITTTTTSITSTTTTKTTTTTTTATTTTTGSNSISTSMVNGPYYAERRIQLSCTIPLTNLTIQTIVQKTVGATYSGAWSTVPGGTVIQSYVDNGSQIIYKWTIINGQTISCPGTYPFVSQFGLSGTSQPNGIDSYIVTTVNNLGGISTMTGFF